MLRKAGEIFQADQSGVPMSKDMLLYAPGRYVHTRFRNFTFTEHMNKAFTEPFSHCHIQTQQNSVKRPLS